MKRLTTCICHILPNLAPISSAQESIHVLTVVAGNNFVLYACEFGALKGGNDGSLLALPKEKKKDYRKAKKGKKGILLLGCFFFFSCRLTMQLPEHLRFDQQLQFVECVLCQK